MASRKQQLAALLDKDPVAPPAIRRGQGYRLSTDPPSDEPLSATPLGVSALVHKGTHQSGRVKRSARGFRLRDDLVRACKRVAFEEDRKLYEVMEEALTEYLARRGVGDRAPR